jgi:hypothetical protein
LPFLLSPTSPVLAYGVPCAADANTNATGTTEAMAVPL